MKMPKKRTIEGPASVLKRIAAFIIDMFLLELVVVYPFRKVFLSAVPDSSLAGTINFFMENPELSNRLYGVTAIMGLLMLLYFAIMEYKLHQTVGKMLMNLYVAEKNLTFWKCVARNLFLIPFFPFVLLWITEPIFMLFTREHQRLLEILTKTKVVEKYPLEK